MNIHKLITHLCFQIKREQDKGNPFYNRKEWAKKHNVAFAAALKNAHSALKELRKFY